MSQRWLSAIDAVVVKLRRTQKCKKKKLNVRHRCKRGVTEVSVKFSAWHFVDRFIFLKSPCYATVLQLE